MQSWNCQNNKKVKKQANESEGFNLIYVILWIIAEDDTNVSRNVQIYWRFT